MFFVIFLQKNFVRMRGANYLTYFSSSHSGLQSTTLTPLMCLTLVHTMPTSAVSMAGTQA